MEHLSSLLQSHAKDFPDDKALATSGGGLTWPQLFTQMSKYAAGLRQSGVSRPILQINHSVSDVCLLLATSLLEGECIIVPGYYPLERVKGMCRKMNCGGVFALEGESLELKFRSEIVPDGGEGSFIGLMTSGTTGDPKCVMHTWTSLTASVKIKPKFRGAKWMIGYPVTHFAGIQVLVQSLSNAGCLVLPKDMTPVAGRATLKENAVQHLSCTPTYIRQLFASKVEFFAKDALEKVVLGGEIVDQKVIDLIQRELPGVRVSHIYASTELGARLEIRDGLEGFPLEMIDGRTMRIKNGELQLMRSSASMIGYLQGVRDTDAWVSTKDIVEVRGKRVIFLGRKDDIVNVGGFKVSPQYVESMIREIPEVYEVAIMAHANPLAGNLVKAKIVLRDGVDPAKMKREIVSKCSAWMPYYMVPRIFEFVDSIEVTDTFKLKRTAT